MRYRSFWFFGLLALAAFLTADVVMRSIAHSLVVHEDLQGAMGAALIGVVHNPIGTLVLFIPFWLVGLLACWRVR